MNNYPKSGLESPLNNFSRSPRESSDGSRFIKLPSTTITHKQSLSDIFTIGDLNPNNEFKFLSNI